MTETPAETLRRAATLARKRAKRSIDENGPIWSWKDYELEPRLSDGPDADHLAPWSPAAAIGVADMWEAGADLYDLDEDDKYSGPATLIQVASLAAARAYLGEAR